MRSVEAKTTRMYHYQVGVEKLGGGGGGGGRITGCWFSRYPNLDRSGYRSGSRGLSMTGLAVATPTLLLLMVTAERDNSG